MPMLSPYVAYGAEPKMLQLIKEQISHNLENGGSRHDQVLARVSSVSRNNIIVWDKESLREIYLTKTDCFTKPIDYLYEALNIFDKKTSNLLTAHDGDVWKKHYRIVSRSFTTDNLRHLCDATTKTADLMFKTRWNLEGEKKSIMLDTKTLSDVTLEGMLHT